MLKPNHLSLRLRTTTLSGLLDKVKPYAAMFTTPFTFMQGQPQVVISCCVMSSSGTWSCPAGTYCVEVCVAGGGGGGGGGAWINSGWGAGGGGGGGGGISYCKILQPSIPSTVSVVIGSGGCAGAAGTFPTCGSNGGNGETSCFGLLVSASGGGGGEGGKIVAVVNPPFCSPTIALGGAGGGGNTATGGAGGCGFASCNNSTFLTGTPGCNSNAGGGGAGGIGRSMFTQGTAVSSGTSTGICGFFPNNNGGAGGNAGKQSPGNPCPTAGDTGVSGQVIIRAFS